MNQYGAQSNVQEDWRLKKALFNKIITFGANLICL